MRFQEFVFPKLPKNREEVAIPLPSHIDMDSKEELLDNLKGEEVNDLSGGGVLYGDHLSEIEGLQSRP